MKKGVKNVPYHFWIGSKLNEILKKECKSTKHPDSFLAHCRRALPAHFDTVLVRLKNQGVLGVQGLYVSAWNGMG